MRWGAPWASGWGSHANHFEYVRPDTTAMIRRGYMTCPVQLKRKATLGDAETHIYINNTKAAQFFDDTGEQWEIECPVPYGANSFSIEAIRVGQLRSPLYECARITRITEHTENKRVTLAWTFTPKVFEPEESSGSYTSSWSFTGLDQGANCAYVDGHPSWGRLTFTIVVALGVATVTVLSNGNAVASGSGAVGTTITLTASNLSGLSGSVAVSGGAVDVTDGVVDVRWPKSMKVKRETVNPPTVVVATVPFKGANEVRWTEASELAAGTYYYRLVPVSDTGSDGTASSVVAVVVIGAPEAPTNLAYSSGTAAALTLGYNRSSTALATYRLYGSLTIGGVADMVTPLATAASGTPSGATTIAAGAVTGFPGKARFLLRAVSAAGVEERNGVWIDVEFDAAGAVVNARPNKAGILPSSIVLTNGLDLSVRGIYNPIREAATATKLYLYTRTAAGSYPGTPDAQGVLAATGQGLKAVTMTFSFVAAGYHCIKVTAVTAGGIESEDAEEIEVLPTAEVLPAATSFSGELARA